MPRWRGQSASTRTHSERACHTATYGYPATTPLSLNRALNPVRYLVNGATIVRDLSFGAVEYFHIELECHDLLLAGGLMAGSYLDTGNRDCFEGAAANRRALTRAVPPVAA
jgi:hypothetical protein